MNNGTWSGMVGELTRKVRLYLCFHPTVKSDTVAVLPRYPRYYHMVIPWYWVQYSRESRGDGDQACGFTAVMGLGLREL